jgi:hypothetical protein
MDQRLAALVERDDPRRYFLASIRRVSAAIVAEVARGGFHDGAWVDALEQENGALYLRTLDDDLAGVRLAGPWAAAFRYARTDPDGPPLRHLLLGINAHLNYGLPQALLATIPDTDVADARLLRMRRLDHAHIDDVLADRVAAEMAELARARPPAAAERLLLPANRVAAQRFLHEARRKVWANFQVLADARRHGPEALRQQLGALERLAGARVEQLVGPGPVLLRLARHGFGVLLPGAEVAQAARR